MEQLPKASSPPPSLPHGVDILILVSRDPEDYVCYLADLPPARVPCQAIETGKGSIEAAAGWSENRYSVSKFNLD